jgi:pimeloyl-ACP methyl ester carboxylesterase
MPRARVNGSELYYEVRGTGPPVLLIMGATGDGGHFDVIADLLCDEFTVVTYDRRGNGRSPAPAGWKTTSPGEQADDAAGLLAALTRSPAVVCGTSSGAVFALCLLARHPAAVRGAILHEPALFAFLDDVDAVRAPLRAQIRSAMETGGPRAATEPFWRYVAGDDAWDKLTPQLRERMTASSETLFGIELGTYERYLPEDETLAAVAPRVRLLVSAGGLPPHTEAARRLGQRLGQDVESTPGTHTAYHDHPIEFAQAIRPLLRELTAITP